MVKYELRYGDITTLQIECIVNASNETGLGCHRPNHPCIDNAIHKKAGPGLYEECKKLNGIPTSIAKITGGHNLPIKYIIHATGPKADNGKEDHNMLAKTYWNILELARNAGIREIAFCSISTGMYGFDKERGALTHLKTVGEWLMKYPHALNKIVFNVFTDEDYAIYSTLLSK